MDKEFNYEQAKKRIEEIASKISNKQIDLKSSLNLFEEAKKLIVQCQDYLSKLKKDFKNN